MQLKYEDFIKLPKDAKKAYYDSMKSLYKPTLMPKLPPKEFTEKSIKSLVKFSIIIVLALLTLTLSIIYGCSGEGQTTTPSCYNESDTTSVCGDNEFRVY